MSEKRFVAEQVDVVNEDETEVWDIVFDIENTYAFMVRDTDTASDLCDLLNEQQSTIQSLKEEKDSLVRVIDENLLKGYHEQSLKHKEAKEKMEHKDERMEASALIDAVFYWKGYVKALEELKERVSDE